MNGNEKRKWEGVRMREGVEEAHAFQIEPMHMYARERKNTHTHYLSACVLVCVIAVACGPLAYQQLHSFRLRRNFNGITTAAQHIELTKSSAKASLSRTLMRESALTQSLALSHSYARSVLCELRAMAISIPIAFCDRR